MADFVRTFKKIYLKNNDVKADISCERFDLVFAVNLKSGWGVILVYFPQKTRDPSDVV